MNEDQDLFEDYETQDLYDNSENQKAYKGLTTWIFIFVVGKQIFFLFSCTFGILLAVQTYIMGYSMKIKDYMEVLPILTQSVFALFGVSLGLFFIFRAQEYDVRKSRLFHKKLMVEEIKLQKEFKEFKKQKEKNNDDDA
tara:strand:- start:4134 stop:4550 length:417 start_codon:yes stop_codon:yes gene_type:complete